MWEKGHFFMENKKSSIQYSDAKLAYNYGWNILDKV